MAVLIRDDVRQLADYISIGEFKLEHGNRTCNRNSLRKRRSMFYEPEFKKQRSYCRNILSSKNRPVDFTELFSTLNAR